MYIILFTEVDFTIITIKNRNKKQFYRDHYDKLEVLSNGYFTIKY